MEHNQFNQHPQWQAKFEQALLGVAKQKRFSDMTKQGVH